MGVGLVRSLQLPDIFGFIGEYITPLLTLARGYSLCPLLISMSEAFSISFHFSSVQLLSRVWLFAIPWISACQASLSITNSRNLLKLMSIKLVMPSNHFHPLSSHSPAAFNLSQHQGLFKWVSSSHWVAKVLEFHLQHQSFQVISFQGIFRIGFL